MEGKSISIDIKKLDEMFNHYIEILCKRAYFGNLSHRGQDEMWYCGEVEECERWLKMFGVDLSYSVVQPLVDKKMKELGW